MELRYEKSDMSYKSYLKSYYIYFESVFVGLFALFLILNFLKINLSNLAIPFAYSGDSLQLASIIKSILDNGWYLSNEYLGAPFGSEHYDFPIPDGGMLILIKIIGYFYPDPWFIYNVIYLGGFIVVAAISYAVLCKFRVNKFFSFAGSILFAFLPFHFFRLHHLFYTWYFTIPIYTFFCINIMLDENKSKPVFVKDVFLLALCASFGIYYAFFASILFIFSAIYSLQLNYPKYFQIQKSIIFIAVISMTLALNLLPNILYKIQNTPNLEVAVRYPAESEIYGLRITQLLLPSPVHRISWFAEKTNKYNKTSPVVNENSTATLGLIGSIGFAFLLISVFMKERTLLGVSGICIIPHLAILNLACLLLGTIGGLGSLFALFVSPSIRAYNRISVFIAFFSITTVMLILQAIINSKKGSNSYLIFLITALFLLSVGLFDQTSAGFIPNYEILKQKYQIDAQFIRNLEASIPSNTMIYQLPYVEYPERGPLYQEEPYSLFRGYLHSKTLRWSYGVMRGRLGDLWLRSMNTLPIEEQIQNIAASGYGGIYIDRQGFKDHAVKLEDRLKLLIFTDPIVSEDSNLAFYRIQPTGTIPVIIPLLDNGFYGWEGGRVGEFTWSSGDAALLLNNPNKYSINIKLHFENFHLSWIRYNHEHLSKF